MNIKISPKLPSYQNYLEKVKLGEKRVTFLKLCEIF